jgi:hypothetical protein
MVVCPKQSREAPIELSPRRKPWENEGKRPAPEGAKENPPIEFGLVGSNTVMKDEHDRCIAIFWMT